MTRAKTWAYALGALTLLCVAASTVLLIMVRQRDPVQSTLTPTAAATAGAGGPVAPATPMGPPSLDAAQAEARPYTLGDFERIAAPVVSVTPKFNPGATVSVSAAVSSAAQNPPGQVTFAETSQYPLRRPPQGFGWPSVTPDANQFFVSLPNGYAQIGQFVSNSNGQGGPYAVASSEYKAMRNRILQGCPSGSSSTSSALQDKGASAVGSLGWTSAAVSLDGQRFYVAYQEPYMGPGAQAQLFPFQQIPGYVGVFSRPPDPQGQPTSQSWTYECTLRLHNPSGAQVAGLNVYDDPVTSEPVTADAFGQVLRVSHNLETNRRVVAMRAQFGLRREAGAVIALYEENTSNVQVLQAVFTLDDQYAQAPSTSFSVSEKRAFGFSFAVGNDALVASVPLAGSGSGAAAYLVCFRRQPGTASWAFHQILTAPSVIEGFGQSVVMHPEGTLMAVGSPALATGTTPGTGGSVYLYARDPSQDAASPWTLTDTLGNGATFTRAFGYFLSADPSFRVLAVSQNQNNVTDQPVTPVSSAPADEDLPRVKLVAIDQVQKLFNTDGKVAPLVQPTPNNGQVIDPTWGARVALAFQNERELRVLVPSPANEFVRLYSVSVG